jgi:hypothetical protein
MFGQESQFDIGEAQGTQGTQGEAAEVCHKKAQGTQDESTLNIQR